MAARVKPPGHDINHPPTSSAKVKERVELYLYPLSVPSWQVIGWTLPLPLLKRMSTSIPFHSITCFLANSCNGTHTLKAADDINKMITEEHSVNTIYNRHVTDHTALVCLMMLQCYEYLTAKPLLNTCTTDRITNAVAKRVSRKTHA